MSIESIEEKIRIMHISWPSEIPFVCNCCGRPIQYLYNDGGRFVNTLCGKVHLYTNYYSCTNSKCIFSNPFTLVQDIVLPFKHFGLDVWKKVIRYHLEFHDSNISITNRLEMDYNLKISTNTAKSIIETYLAANSLEADSETYRLVKESGKIYLALDGQKPNNGESSLWIFIDTITDKILHMEYLDSANWEILSEIFKKIEAKYQVPIKIVLSDHQSSIIKAVKKTFGDIPHQFCHYHFIKNLHRGIDALDSHLRTNISSIINKLYICNIPDEYAFIQFHGIQLDLREWLDPIVKDLKRLAKKKTRDFDFFAGFNLYENLEFYLELMNKLIEQTKPIKRLHRLLERTKHYLKLAIKDYNFLYLKIKRLIPRFNEIRAILGTKSTNQELVRQNAEKWCDKLKRFLKSNFGKKLNKKLKYKKITYKSSLEDILIEWVRLYSTHESGLFHSYNIPDLPRSNVELEQIFSTESHHFRAASGKSQVGDMIRVKGGELCQVIKDYDPNKIEEILLNSNREQIKFLIQEFRSRQKKQSESWHFKKNEVLKITKVFEKLQKIIPSR